MSDFYNNNVCGVDELKILFILEKKCKNSVEKCLCCNPMN